MAATGRTLSPGGALLRASRMFSLPSAIPPPPGEHQAASSSFSNTATQTYPTLQTVTAPEQFRQRGDWGFKRNFPLRSTARTSTPYLRVKQVDSMEQVTDFESASGHALSLEKMQEMNIAISLPHATSGVNETIEPEPLQSVFEDEFDFTALDAERIAAAGQKRWKYKGPWLASLTHGEFQKFLKKQIRGRREEFRQVIREHLAKQQTTEAVRLAIEAGTSDQGQQPDVRPEAVTDEQIAEFCRTARNQPGQLYQLISQFLDLAPIDYEGLDHLEALQPNQSKEVNSIDPYAKYGPPITHPSAGLSYLRTAAFLDNHPVYGPQRQQAPIQARVLGITDHAGAKAAVGGFVANPNMNVGKAVGVEYLSPGGTKWWAHVASAQVDSTGRIMLQLKAAQVKDTLVQQEMQGKKRVFRGSVETPELDQSPVQALKTNVRPNIKPAMRFSGPGSYGA